MVCLYLHFSHDDANPAANVAGFRKGCVNFRFVDTMRVDGEICLSPEQTPRFIVEPQATVIQWARKVVDV